MTSTETGPTWSERFNPRNWTLAWKLVIVCLIPALLALALGVLRVSDQAGQAAELGRSSRLLEVAQQVSTTADALRAERNASTLFAAGNRTDNRAALEDGFRQTDTEIDQMLAAVHGTSELEVTTRSALQKTERELQILPPLRTDAAQDVAVDYDQVKSRYTAVIDSVDILGRALLRQLSTPGIGGLPDALTAVMNITEQLAAQHTELGAAIRSRTLRPQDAEAATAADSQLTAAAREYSSALTLGVVGNPLDETANTQRENLKAAILDTPANKPITSVRADEWDAAYIDADAAADRASTRIRKALSASSAAAEERASNEAGLNSVILMLGLLIGATIAVLVARALLRSLQILRTTALDVAERRLPQAVEGMRAGETPDVEVDPVPLGGRDEVAQVARAFDAVHGQAVRLAAEQAALQSNVSAMFVNLSRRSQALVERQLQLIEQLESNEQDPDQLSNLFQLDHLATRMRRNSENLLVLAGTDLAKRNIAPIPMVDVLRAAVSEVEQYQRIVVQAPPSVTVVGRAASDLVHLLAELLDNATSFSPPDSQVVMSTARTGDGSIVVEIADRGVGMVDHELNDANQRLSGPAGVDVSASRRMGLFVVGRLGARHGISVRLSTSSAGGPGAGLTASVTVPGYLIPSSNEPAETHRPAAAIPTRTNTLTAQRPGTNGTVRPGSLSALVAGTDGPANPAGVFDAPAGHDGQLFAPQPPPVNGSLGKLPTRRPGQSVRPDGPNPPPPNNRPDPAEQAAADQAKAEQQQMQLQRARELAAKAAADAAKISEQQQQRREQQRSSGQPPGSQNTGSYRNGVQPDSARSVWGSTSETASLNGYRPSEPATSNGSSQTDISPSAPSDDSGSTSRQQAATSGEQKAAAGPGGDQEPKPGEDSTPDEGASAPPTGAFPADTMFSGEGQPQRGTPTQVPPSPLTMPMPILGRSNPLPPPRPTNPRPEQQQATPRPFPQSTGQRAQQPAQPGAQAAQPAQPGAQSGAQAAQQAPAAQAQAQAAQQGQAAEPAAAQSSTEPAREADELFAPSVPVIAEPAPAAASSRKAEEFDLSETTPIFEEIASAWFRSNRPIPVNWQTEQGGAGRPSQQRGFRPPAPHPQSAPRPLSAPHPLSAPAPTRPPAAATPPPAPAPKPVAPPAPTPPPAPPSAPTPPPAPAPTAAPAPAPAPTPAPSVSARPVADKPATPEPAAPASASDQEFASLADEGWRAASTVAAEQADEITAAGLPKRRPRARLVPGSAGSAVLAPPVSSARSAETVRGRLASYQHGVRQGRESRLRGGGGADPGSEANGGTKPTNAGVNHDEESS